MGASVSKQGRKLTKVVSENAKTQPLKRSSNINPLPSQTLKERYDQQPILEPTKGESSNIQQPQDSSLGPTSSFDPGFLSKKLNKQKIIPEGKDGGDPHVEGTDTYQKGFVDSVTRLGKQVHSVEFNPLMNDNVVVLKQLKLRKTISEIAEQELDNEKNSSSSGVKNFRTMVHPHTLTAILSDLKDPRMTHESITKDYQLHPGFLKELGDIFSVPTTTMPIEDDAPKQEEFLGDSEADAFTPEELEEYEQPENKLDRKRYEKLKGRIEI